MNKISNQMNDDGGITNQQKQQRVEKSEMKWIELKMKMELRRESGKRLWQWRWRARTNELAFTHSVVCAPARWRPETNKNHEELQIELIHTRMPKWMNKKKMKNTHTHSEQETKPGASETKILTMVLNKSIKHQMFLKYDFQPQDMVFDMNSIIITIQNANSTTSDVPASVSEELLTACTWIKRHSQIITNINNNSKKIH